MPWALLVAAVLGAIAGDGFSFWLGIVTNGRYSAAGRSNRFPWLIERSAQFIRKYGITSVFLARFTAVVRAFVPLLAGTLRMPSRQFYVANILSALVWAPMHVFPGVLLGLAVAFGGAHAPQLSLAAVGADIDLDRLEDDQIQDRCRFGVRSQPTCARIRRMQIFPANFPGRPH
jgi:membrane protein DedA with SNARE-associated domain